MSTDTAPEALGRSISGSYWKALGEGCWNDVHRRGLVLSDDPYVRGLQVRNWLLHIKSELSEAYEETRTGRPFTDTYLDDEGKPCGFGVELAEEEMALPSLAHVTGVDLGEAIDGKYSYNCSRAPGGFECH
jgi:hypothetical protein